MAGYADIEKIEKLLVRGIDECGDAIISIRDVRKAIAQAKTADVQEVKHAKFGLISNGKGVCSNCHRLDYIDKLAEYCRYCGAKMDAKE